MTLLRSALAIPLCLGLSACGGSSTGVSFDEVLDQGALLSDMALAEPIQDPLTLPATGTATYDGFMIFRVETDVGATGEIELTANFSDNSIEGTATNFVGSGDERMSGSLDISNGNIDRTVDIDAFYTFAADIDGQLSVVGEPLTVDARLNGDFRGSDHRFVEGEVSGSVDFDGERLNITAGAFVGER